MSRTISKNGMERAACKRQWITKTCFSTRKKCDQSWNNGLFFTRMDNRTCVPILPCHTNPTGNKQKRRYSAASIHYRRSNDMRWNQSHGLLHFIQLWNVTFAKVPKVKSSFPMPKSMRDDKKTFTFVRFRLHLFTSNENLRFFLNLINQPSRLEYQEKRPITFGCTRDFSRRSFFCFFFSNVMFAGCF